MDVKEELIEKLIELSFAEDIGDGDHTTLSSIPEDAMGENILIIKEDGVLAGVEMAKRIFAHFDKELKVEVLMEDGTEVKKGDIAMRVSGKVRSLLQTERLMLNVMQRMSGIATMTRKYVKQLEGTNTRVLDTRKTTPGMRIMEKEAVKIGGGVNHRIGLFDMILLKDNHVDFAGGIKQAIERAKEYCKAKGKDLKIEIEVRNFDELQQVLDLGGVDRIMFDNFDTDASVMYTYTPEKAEDVPAVVTGWYGAGRLNHGDITHTFADNTGNEETDSEPDDDLAAKIDGYVSPLIEIFGEDATTPGDDPGDEPQPGDDPTPEGTITCSFAKDGTPSNTFFTVSGNGSNSKGTVKIDGTEYTTCLKIESTTSVKFTLTATYKMTLYFGPSETASIKINGTKIAGSGNTYSQTLTAGSYELTKDKSVNLFFIKLVKLSE